MNYTEYNEGHASAQPIADDVHFKPVQLLNADLGNSDNKSLSNEEIESFKLRGFLVKRRVLQDSKALNAALNHFWERVPRGIIQRDDPNTWWDSPHSKLKEEDVPNVGMLRGTNWKMRSPGPSGIGTESFLVDGIANHPSMIDVVESFLGAPVNPVTRVRGIYGVLPKKVDAKETLHPHGDYMASELSAMVLLHDTPPHSGGFTVWPGSHVRMHLHWDKVHGSTIGESKAEGFRLARDQVLRDTDPVEFIGTAGDVIFWHPRLLHSAGVNFSLDIGQPRVRIIVPCDYQRADMTYIDNLDHGPGPVYQWWVDTRNTAEDIESSSNNMWDRWAID